MTSCADAVWRYTEWAAFGCDPMKPMICETSIEPRWDEVWGVELYSHKGDEANDFGK